MPALIQTPQNWNNFSHRDAREELRAAFADVRYTIPPPGIGPVLNLDELTFLNGQWISGNLPLEAGEISAATDFFYHLQFYLSKYAPWWILSMIIEQYPGEDFPRWQHYLRDIFMAAGLGDRNLGGWGFRYCIGTEYEIGIQAGRSHEELVAEGAQFKPALFYPFSINELPGIRFPPAITTRFLTYLNHPNSMAKKGHIAGPWLTQDISALLEFLQRCRDEGIQNVVQYTLTEVTTAVPVYTYFTEMTKYPVTTQLPTTLYKSTDKLLTGFRTEPTTGFTQKPTTKETVGVTIVSADTVVGQRDTVKQTHAFNMLTTFVGYTVTYGQYLTSFGVRQTYNNPARWTTQQVTNFDTQVGTAWDTGYFESNTNGGTYHEWQTDNYNQWQTQGITNVQTGPATSFWDTAAKKLTTGIKTTVVERETTYVTLFDTTVETDILGPTIHIEPDTFDTLVNTDVLTIRNTAIPTLETAPWYTVIIWDTTKIVDTDMPTEVGSLIGYTTTLTTVETPVVPARSDEDSWWLSVVTDVTHDAGQGDDWSTDYFDYD